MIDPDRRRAIYQMHLARVPQVKIARQYHVSRHTVWTIIRQRGAMPQIARKDKIQIDPDLLRRLHKECKGQAWHVHQKLTMEAGPKFSYPTLTRAFRELGLRHPTKAETDGEVRNWVTQIIHGGLSLEATEAEPGGADRLADLVQFARHGGIRKRKKAIVVLARERGIPNIVIARVLHSSHVTTKQYFKVYRDMGPSVLFGPNPQRSEVRIGDAEKMPRIIELLHHKPRAFGINRTSWTQNTLIQAYKATHHKTIGRRVLKRIVRKAGYRWKKARRVLTSPDPDYHEKVERLLRILRSLTADELFFFLDEWGPIQVKRRGGKAYLREGDETTIPRRQKPKGTVTFVAALSATTNQLTWLFEPCKDTRSMENLLEILYNQYHTKSKLYVTWDAVSWHRSIELTDWIDHFNDATRKAATGPVIEVVPLPTSAQFLNVIEGVLTAMTKAIIHNSDYQSSEEMKSAISCHFRERNAHFRDNPKRAGRKIWDLEFFNEHESLRSGNYRES